MKFLKFTGIILSLSLLAIFIFGNRSAQAITPPDHVDGEAYRHYADRLDVIQKQKVMKGGILFLGDSITEGCAWESLFPRIETRNQGIGWDNVSGLERRLFLAMRHSPNTIIMMTGIKDLSYKRDPVETAQHIQSIAGYLGQEMPRTRLIVHSILPSHYNDPWVTNRANAALANKIRALRMPNVSFVDLTPSFSNRVGQLPSDLTYDGTHLTDKACEIRANIIKSSL